MTATEDRVFTDARDDHHADRIRAKALERYGVGAVWARKECRGPTGRPYWLRRLVVVRDGQVVAVAACNCRGAVRFYESYIDWPYEIEAA